MRYEMIHSTKFMSLNFINVERIIQHHVLLVETSLSLSFTFSMNQKCFLFICFSLSHTHTQIVNESLPIPTPDTHRPPPLSMMFIYIRLSVYLCWVPCTPVSQPAVTDRPARCNFSIHTPPRQLTRETRRHKTDKQ